MADQDKQKKPAGNSTGKQPGAAPPKLTILQRPKQDDGRKASTSGTTTPATAGKNTRAPNPAGSTSGPKAKPPQAPNTASTPQTTATSSTSGDIAGPFVSRTHKRDPKEDKQEAKSEDKPTVTILRRKEDAGGKSTDAASSAKPIKGLKISSPKKNGDEIDEAESLGANINVGALQTSDTPHLASRPGSTIPQKPAVLGTGVLKEIESDYANMKRGGTPVGYGAPKGDPPPSTAVGQRTAKRGDSGDSQSSQPQLAQGTVLGKGKARVEPQLSRKEGEGVAKAQLMPKQQEIIESTELVRKQQEVTESAEQQTVGQVRAQRLQVEQQIKQNEEILKFNRAVITKITEDQAKRAAKSNANEVAKVNQAIDNAQKRKKELAQQQAELTELVARRYRAQQDRFEAEQHKADVQEQFTKNANVVLYYRNSAFVSNLPFKITEKDLGKFFERGPQIQEITLHQKEKKPNGTATIRYNSKVEVQQAIRTFRGSKLDGFKIGIREDRVDQTVIATPTTSLKKKQDDGPVIVDGSTPRSDRPTHTTPPLQSTVEKAAAGPSDAELMPQPPAVSATKISDPSARKIARSNRLLMQNLPLRFNGGALRQLLSNTGSRRFAVERDVIYRGELTNSARVTYDSEGSAQRAMDSLDNTVFEDHKLQISSVHD